MLTTLSADDAKAPKRCSSKSETIARLLRSARQEFALNGLAKANMESIARGAGVTKQLLYQYYGSKYDLFSAVLDQASAETMPKLLALDFAHLPPRDALLAFLNQVFDQYRADPLLGRLAREGMRFHEEHPSPHNRFLDLAPLLVEKLEAILTRGAASGDFEPGLDSRACTAFVSLLMTGGFTNGYTLSVILDMDVASGSGADTWRNMASAFFLQAVSRKAART
jgi:AcrR family transcriptional regulator